MATETCVSIENVFFYFHRDLAKESKVVLKFLVIKQPLDKEILARQTVRLDDVGDEQDGREHEGNAPRRDVKRALTLLKSVLFHFT